MEEFLAQWLVRCQHGRKIKPATASNYAQLVYTHIAPELGREQVADLTAERLQAFLDKKAAEGRLDGHGGLSPKTVQGLYTVLNSSFAWGARMGLVAENPTRSLESPSAEQPEIRVLAEEEQMRLEDCLSAQRHVLAMAVWLSLYLGLRVGEVSALRWGDVDERKRRVHICRTLQRLPVLEEGRRTGRTELVVGPPKSAKGDRWLPAPDFLWTLLMDYRRALPERAAAPGAFIVQQKNGRPFEPRAIQRYFTKLCGEARIDHANYHSLRHTFATRALERRMDYKTLSDILGHADLAVTMRYAHSLDELKRREMDKMERLSPVRQMEFA